MAIATAAAGLALAGAAFARAHDPAAEVRAGKLGLTQRLGWVNWHHAADGGVRAVWEEIQGRLDHTTAFPVEVSYHQEMRGRLGPLAVHSRLTRFYRIDRPLAAPMRRAAAWQVFRETAEAFEAMQGRNPDALQRQSAASSFRDGDLAGDWLAFQTAVEGRDPAALAAWAGPLPMDAALARLAAEGLARNRRWPGGGAPYALEVPGVTCLREEPRLWRLTWR